MYYDYHSYSCYYYYCSHLVMAVALGAQMVGANFPFSWQVNPAASTSLTLERGHRSGTFGQLPEEATTHRPTPGHRKSWMLGWLMCKTVPYIQGVSVAASVYSLIAVSLDRIFSGGKLDKFPHIDSSADPQTRLVLTSSTTKPSCVEGDSADVFRSSLPSPDDGTDFWRSTLACHGQAIDVPMLTPFHFPVNFQKPVWQIFRIFVLRSGPPPTESEGAGLQVWW
uniref:Uncharacterized protein n=1 Tax=Anopheles atroparvus TaxID=41427 RepID=A0A182J723_ANOAO